MNRRNFLTWTGIGSAAIGTGLMTARRGYAQTTRPAAAPEPAPSQPALSGNLPGRNVLFLVADDLMPLLGAYGSDVIRTPNLDRLAARGVLCEKAFCQIAVCTPSRISLLTGTRPDTSGSVALSHHYDTLRTPFRSLPNAFLQAGYETVSIGKVYHHPRDEMAAWSVPPWRDPELWQEYHEPKNVAVRQGLIAEWVAGGRKGPRPEASATDAGDVDDFAYNDGRQTQLALIELERMSRQFERYRLPFFLALGLRSPHLPFTSPKKYWDLYDPADIDVPPPDTAPAGAPAWAMTRWGELRRYAGMPKEGPVTEDQARHLIHGYYAATSYADALLGRVIDRLDELGRFDDTTTVLWGDHGYHLGEHGMWCKHTNFDHATHSPLLFAGAGVPRGVRLSGVCELLDVYPTLCDLTGVAKPQTLEGTSLVPYFERPDAQIKPAAFSQYPRQPGETGMDVRVMGYSARESRHRYTRWHREDDARVVAEELYDYEIDTLETRNVADDPAYADVKRRLNALLDPIARPTKRPDLSARPSGGQS